MFKHIKNIFGGVLLVGICLISGYVPADATVDLPDNYDATQYWTYTGTLMEMSYDGNGGYIVLMTKDHGCPGVLVISHAVDLSEGDYEWFGKSIKHLVGRKVSVSGFLLALEEYHLDISKAWYLDNGENMKPIQVTIPLDPMQ